MLCAFCAEDRFTKQQSSIWSSNSFGLATASYIHARMVASGLAHERKRGRTSNRTELPLQETVLLQTIALKPEPAACKSVTLLFGHLASCMGF